MEIRDFGTEMERRTYTAELRVEAPTLGKKSPTIRGYAAKFNSLSQAMPVVEEGKVVAYFREQLMPGCFASAIPVSDIRSLFNHDPNLILGRTTAGTLRIAEDEVGLAFENDPPDTTYSRDLQISMQRGDITQCSFGFNVAEGGDSWTKDASSPGNYIRSINCISKLYDASPVTYPAYVNTDCAVRSAMSVIRNEEASIAKLAADKVEEERAFEMEQVELELKLAELEI
jgi:HK97 family phage prohead protease